MLYRVNPAADYTRSLRSLIIIIKPLFLSLSLRENEILEAVHIVVSVVVVLLGVHGLHSWLRYRMEVLRSHSSILRAAAAA